MASRLYRTTRQLYLTIEHCLRRLRLHKLGSPTLLTLMAWTVTGLLLLDARPTQTRVARVLPGRCHDALNRLLRDMPWSTRALSRLLIAFARQLGRDGYLVLDEVIVEKAYAKRLPWATSIYSFAKKRKVWGFQIVVLVWCSCDGQWRIPLASGCGGPSGRVGQNATARSWSWHGSWCRPSSWHTSRCSTSWVTPTTRRAGLRNG
ncbi:MAG: transposase [Chloroflexota bacterium]|nr:transposase [Chloroflexota bacterium]